MQIKTIERVESLASLLIEQTLLGDLVTQPLSNLSLKLKLPVASHGESSKCKEFCLILHKSIANPGARPRRAQSSRSGGCARPVE
jgi:hypothetical protein